MKTLPLLLLLFAGPVLAAQTNLSTGGPAPKINVTNWLLNEPADKNLNGKFVVLEFWATWCGPCIAAIPHLNKLQAKFDRPDLYFISITDESVAKVKQSLDRLNFSSIVATDVSKQTQIAFGDGKKGLEAFPMTVLISPTGKVTWVGEPKQLTEKVMNAFLAGDLDPVNLLTDQPHAVKPTFGLPTTGQEFLELYQQGNALYTFGISETNTEKTDFLIMGNHALFFAATTLSELYDLAFNTTLYEIYDLDSLRYDLTYIDKSMDTTNMARVEETLRRTLGLKKELFEKEITTYTVKIADRPRLRPTLNTLFTTKSSADGVFVFKNVTVNEMLKSLGNKMKTQLYCLDQDDGKYDFNIAIDSAKSMLQSLQSYGFRTTEKSTKIKAMRLVK